ncbi:MAG: hypothetical protein JNJ85_15885 [Candidatus Kapabacteria bacterium]|nr:hypothetical protein [Candidatus Kapabacteria bacterium]MBX7155598.1 hypothetical protein [Bacteroidota bacterium]
METEDKNKTVTLICNFLNDIGIHVVFGPINYETVLPGIDLFNGGLLIDTNKLLYPGDILHEAGHLAVMPPNMRTTANGAIDPKIDLEMAGELMAIPWSYAAALYIGISPGIVFHDNGYQGGGSNIVDNFKEGRFIGVPMLQWIGLCFDEIRAKENHTLPFPAMIKWLRE